MTVKRLRAAEYQNIPGWLSSTSALHGIKQDELQRVIQRAASRVSTMLRLTDPAMFLNGDRLSILGISGLIQLSESLELEVVPKFLDGSSDTWREDFFFLASISTQSSILSRDTISSSLSDQVDMASVIGRYLVNEVEKRRRRPLRSYQIHEWHEWTTDGEPDVIDLIFPSEEGFLQRGLKLSRSNEYNAVILAAVRNLIPRVSDATVRQRLIRVGNYLGAQKYVRGNPRAQMIPARHSQWQPAYDVSLKVLDGLGLSATIGSYSSPGFVINSWRLWEDLIRRAIHLRFREHARYHSVHNLGHHLDGTSAEVIPDMLVTANNGVSLVIDAKYKGRFGLQTKISNADLYESLAFMKATGTSRTLLIYPMTEFQDGVKNNVGNFTIFDRIFVGEQQVVGAMISVSEISQRQGLGKFVQGLSNLIEGSFDELHSQIFQVIKNT